MPPIRPVAIAAILLIFPSFARSQDPAPTVPPAEASAPAPGAVADSGQLARNTLFESIIKLHMRPRIAAKIDQTVDMLNQKFELHGSYYKDTGNRVRLQLETQAVGDKGLTTMLQVCDGKILWEYQQVLGVKYYRKQEVTPILKKLEDSGLDEDFKALIINSLGFGGPEGLLGGLQGTIEFNQFADNTVDGVPSYILGGTWKDRSRLVGPNDRPLTPTSPLPPYIPSNVQLFIEKATLWPYRIEMIGTVPTEMIEDVREIDKNTGRPIGVRKPQPKISPSKITLLYTLLPESEIKPDEQFVFTAPRDATNVVDETDTFLKGLDQAILFKQNEKRAKEAAGEAADAPIKAPPLDLPTPPPTPIGAEPTVPR